MRCLDFARHDKRLLLQRFAEDIWQLIVVSAICAPANILEFRHAQTSGTKLHKMGNLLICSKPRRSLRS